ncbi:putative substrate-binding protein [Escherichia coli]|uniref:Putative substrate-binding protein n=1 Tax=Escherichia coli TaxID=562 RepID=A0A2X1Q2P9_ECOLX|nr:putative substrate-binding protein [Escherichia coli]
MILPREWETLSNFASHPIGTGPYAVIRNSTNQLKIQAFDDFFGYRALIDEVTSGFCRKLPTSQPEG